ERFIESPSSESVLVLVANRKTALARLVDKKGAVVTLDPPRGRSLVAWLRRRAGERSLKLDDRAGWALLDAVGSELRDLDTALEQLATQLDTGATVTPAEIQRAFPRLADERMYAFTDAVGERRLPQAMTALRRLLDQEDVPLVVFGALSSHLRRLLIARSYAEGGPRAVGEALGLPEWRARRVHQQAKAFRLEELREAMQVLARTDLEIKGGDLSPEAALERAVVEIVSARTFF
ncbi:MAG: DNA polymerase III subunit delta, partial [Actinomycetota bacterium]|nr:DNA polymerase III subunit delta [Actinomycetota bacterium]